MEQLLNGCLLNRRPSENNPGTTDVLIYINNIGKDLSC